MNKKEREALVEVITNKIHDNESLTADFLAALPNMKDADLEKFDKCVNQDIQNLVYETYEYLAEEGLIEITNNEDGSFSYDWTEKGVETRKNLKSQ